MATSKSEHFDEEESNQAGPTAKGPGKLERLKNPIRVDTEEEACTEILKASFNDIVLDIIHESMIEAGQQIVFTPLNVLIQEGTTVDVPSDFLPSPEESIAFVEQNMDSLLLGIATMIIGDVLQEELPILGQNVIDHAYLFGLPSNVTDASASVDQVYPATAFSTNASNNASACFDASSSDAATMDQVHSSAACSSMHGYLSKHRWMKCWGDRHTKSASKLGTVMDRANVDSGIPKAPEWNPLFRWPSTCELNRLQKLKFRGTPEQMKCTAMLLQPISPKTSFICMHCGVFLHRECHNVYHQDYATDRMLRISFHEK